MDILAYIYLKFYKYIFSPRHSLQYSRISKIEHYVRYNQNKEGLFLH